MAIDYLLINVLQKPVSSAFTGENVFAAFPWKRRSSLPGEFRGCCPDCTGAVVLGKEHRVCPAGRKGHRLQVFYKR